MTSRPAASDPPATATNRAQEHRRILSSKFGAPPRRPGVVDRPALVRRLCSLDHVPVVLVSAPAGYGKTTLLGLWAERDARPFAWIRVDGTDDDPAVLVTAVVDALETSIDVGLHLQRLLPASDHRLDELLAALVVAWTATGRPLVLVLDDVHHVTAPAAQRVVQYLAEHLPERCQIVLATRSDPPLPVASWRAHGQLVELRAADLALGDDEAAALLAIADVRLTDTQVRRLVERTEGWSAALYLAALSLRGRSDPQEFIDSFTGTSRHVADFLSEDVWARLEPDVVDFLLGTCVVDELTASLCDTLRDAPHSQEMLETLERTNLFVVPLDQDRRTYRHHQLFAEYLRAELHRRAPERVPLLHQRAWRWYRDHGLFGRAVAHACASGDVGDAAEMVAAQWLSMVERGRVATMRTWLGAFTDGQIESHAPLAVAAAWVCGFSGERDRAVRFAEAARRGHWTGPMPDGTASLESAVAIMSAALGLDGVSGMLSDARRAVDLEPPDGRWHAGAMVLLGEAQVLAGELTDARRTLETATRLINAEHATAATALAYLAFVELQEGQVEQAWAHIQRAHEIVEQPPLRGHLPNVSTYGALAEILSRRGDLDGTARAVARAEELLAQLTDTYWWQLSLTRIQLAPALAALGRRADAVRYLADSAELLAGHPDAGMLPEWTEQARRAIGGPRRGRPRSPLLSDAERRVLRLLASDLTLREIGRELYLSHNTVRTHAHSIYRKLGVSSRADAVTAARAASTASQEGEQLSPG